MRQLLESNLTVINVEHNRIIESCLFVVLLLVDICSILCTLLNLLFFCTNWDSLMRKYLHNHAIFLLMIISFLYTTLDLPWTIHRYRLGYDSYRSQMFCLVWFWFDYSLSVNSLFVTAIGSIQRHVLVFRSGFLYRNSRRWLIHYFPLMLAIVYPTVFYTIFIFIYPCHSSLDENEQHCSHPCYSDLVVLFYIDWIFNTLMPVLIIVVANGALIVRVLSSLDRVRRCRLTSVKRRQRVTFPLFAFSMLYLLGWGPSTIVAIVQMFFRPDLYRERPRLIYIHSSSYFICPLQSIICFFSIPKLTRLMKNNKQRRTVSAPFVQDTRF